MEPESVRHIGMDTDAEKDRENLKRELEKAQEEMGKVRRDMEDMKKNIRDDEPTETPETEAQEE